MRKTWKRLFCLALLIMLCLGGSTAFSDENGQLTVKIGKDNSPFQRKGIKVELFRISEEMNEGNWQMLPAFSSVTLPTVSTAQQTDTALADIRQIIGAENIRPTATGTTDSKGKAVFSGLANGVYFGRVTEGPEYLTVQDFLVSVPQKQNGSWVNTAEADLKFDYAPPEPTEEPTAEPTEEPTPEPEPTVMPPPRPTPTTAATTANPTPSPKPTPTARPNPYHLVIHYIYAETGDTAWPDHHETLWEGDAYDVLSPILPEYLYDIAEVTGVMPGHNVEFTVMYFTKKPGWSYYSIEDYETALGIGTIQMHVGVCFE